MFSPYHSSNQSLPTVRVDGQFSGKPGTGYKPHNKSRLGPRDGASRQVPQFPYGPQEPMSYPTSPYSVHHYAPMANAWGIPSYSPPSGIQGNEGMRGSLGDPPIASNNSGYGSGPGVAGQSPVGTPRLPYPHINVPPVAQPPQPHHPHYGGYASPPHPSSTPRNYDAKAAWSASAGRRSPTKRLAVDDKFRKPFVRPSGLDYDARGMPLIKPTPEGLKKAGPTTPPCWLNTEGFPLRPGKPDCKHYISKGWCAYQTLCKFNHPEPGHRSPIAQYQVPPPPAPTPQMVPAAWGGTPPPYYWGPWGPQVPPAYMMQPPCYPSMYYPGPASIDSGVSTLSNLPNIESEGSDHGSFRGRTPRG